jgi:plastocyanin
MRSVRFAALAAALILTAACGNGSSSSPSSPTPATPPATGGPSSAVTIPMGASTLTNRAFAPDEVDVAVGDTVTWMNTDAVAHTSTSDASAWDSGVVAPGGRFSRAFQTAGTFEYHCAIHHGMVGTVVVR